MKRQDVRACVTIYGKSRMRDFLGNSRACVTIYGYPRMGKVHSIIIIQRVKMGDLPDFTELLKSPERLQLKCIIKLTNCIIVKDLSEKYDVHRVIPHETRDEFPLTDWRFHVQETDLTNVPSGKTFMYPAMQVELSRYFVMKFCVE